MKFIKLPIEKINPAPYNPRKDLKPGDLEFEMLRKSMREFELVEPLFWNKRTGNLVGGHQRLEVLIDEGMTEVDVSVVDLPMSKEKALNLALNKLQGDWDMRKLKDLIIDIDTGEFDIEITGFDEKSIEDLMTWASVDTITSDTLWSEKTRNQGSGTTGVVCFSEFGAGIPHVVIDKLVAKIKEKWGDDPKVAIPAYCEWLEVQDFG